MKQVVTLRVVSPLSTQFLAALPDMQALLRAWRTYLQCVPVEAPHESLEPDAGQRDDRGVGLFFSGGVDSFYSLLQHRAEITHLIFVHGFDSLLAHTRVRERNAQALRQAAAELGKPVIEVESNWRDVVDRYEPWSHHTATAAQLSVAQLLSRQFSRIYVAENYDYFAEKSQNSLSSVMHTGEVDIVLDGIDCLRLDKTVAIASSPTVLRWLRVCWQNTSLAYNCGHCEKCLRTMIALHLAGALGRCRTFARPLDPEGVRCLKLGDPTYFWPELLLAMEQRGDQPALTEAVLEALRYATDAGHTWESQLAALDRRGDMPALAAVVRRCLAWQQAPAAERLQSERLRGALERAYVAEQELAIIKASRSWRLTAPLRTARAAYRRIRSRFT
jgi:hypothetical protein